MRRVFFNFIAAFLFICAGGISALDIGATGLVVGLVLGIIGWQVQCLREPTEYESHNVIYVPGEEVKP